MAPKKDKKKQNEPVQPELVTAYKAREPLAAVEPPDVSEVDAQWKALRDQYVQPLPAWNAENVDAMEWKPNETEEPFVSNQFSVFAMPRSFAALVAGWRRAGASALAKGDLLPEEPEPQAQPIPDLKEEPSEPVPDAKAKAKPKADTKAKAKGKNQPEEPPEKPTTMQQYADCTYEGEARVVSQAEFRSRELLLDLDDAAPQLSQAIASQIAAVAEHRLLLPGGCFLWELIHPQDEEGLPLYNPHGKYVVKLFVQGKWRQVAIDDVVPVGYAMHGNNTYASLLPSHQDINIIWPQLLSKALIQAFQDDLNMPVLPCITALTGWVPYQLPLSWSALQGLKAVRTFCTLQTSSQVDFEARQRAELMPSIPQAEAQAGSRKSVAPMQAPAFPPGQEQNLKLGNQPQEALLEFLVCETEEEPRQVRLKADAFVAQHGTPRKQVRDADSEEEDGSADAGNTDGQPVRADEEVDDSDRDDLDEDDDGRSQNTHSGEGEGVEKRTTDQGGSQSGEGAELEQEEEPEMSDMPWVAPWPNQNPHPLLMKSSIQEFQAQLQGGCWVSFEEIEGTTATFCSYIPPGEHVLTATLDTCWDGERAQAFLPPKTCLLRICLVLQELEQGTSRTGIAAGDSKPTPGPPWLQTVFSYEPLKQNGRLSESPPTASPCSCVLQAVNSWRPSSQQALEPPDCINLTVGEGSQPSSISYSSLLPPGEHWYLVSDDAAELAGSVLSVSVEGLLLNGGKSSVDFVEPAKALAKYQMALLPVGPLQYPIHTGYCVWAKSEILVSEAYAGDLQTLQLLCHLTDATLWPYIQLSCLRVSELESKADDPLENRCASWSVSTVLKSPLLRVMSLPLEDEEATGPAKYVLMLEANLPPEVLPKTGGEISIQIFGPPGTAPEPEDFSEGAEKDGEDGLVDEVPLQLHMLPVDKVMRWQGDCSENDKGLVLCERITVPADGDVTSTLRITVERLPQAFLRATLVAQMPPTEDMRPPDPEGNPLEPLVPGAPINPRDYSGRRNWLSRCKKVAETSGLEIVSFSHVLLRQASTYLLYVHLDQFRGPASLDGGAWLLESFGSGSLEVGPDAMEQDLEELVRKSWESPQEGDAKPRSEKAAETREAWVSKKSGHGGDEDTGERSPEEEEVMAVLERTREVTHPNSSIAKFLCGHADTPAVLIQEDPYTVAPDRPEWNPAEDTDGLVAEEVSAEDTEAVAVKALGTDGERQARELEIELSTARWQSAKERLEVAKERNANQIQELRQWREERAAVPGGVPGSSFAGARSELRGALHSRMEKCAVLKILCFDEKRVDPEPLRAALSEADVAGARNYDPDLMDNGTRKLRVLDAAVAFQESIVTAEAKIDAAATASSAVQAMEEGNEGFAEAKDAASTAAEEAAAAANVLSDLLSEFKASIKDAQACEIPVPVDLLNEERLEKAAALLEQHAAAAAAVSAETETA